jgi:hypothetical protein
MTGGSGRPRLPLSTSRLLAVDPALYPADVSLDNYSIPYWIARHRVVARDDTPATNWKYKEDRKGSAKEARSPPLSTLPQPISYRPQRSRSVLLSKLVNPRMGKHGMPPIRQDPTEV